MKKKFLIFALIFVALQGAAQFFLDPIARIFPEKVCLISYSNSGFMAYRKKFQSGELSPVKIGMKKYDVENLFSKKNKYFKILENNHERDIILYTGRIGLVRVQYELLFNNKVLAEAALTCKVFAL